MFINFKPNMPRHCSFCDIAGHNIRSCNSNEFFLLKRKSIERSQKSINEHQLPMRESCCYISWLFTLTFHQLKGLVYHHLGHVESRGGRNRLIALLALKQCDRFPYNEVETLYNNNLVNIMYTSVFQSQMIHNIWTRMLETGMNYEQSSRSSLIVGRSYFLEYFKQARENLGSIESHRYVNTLEIFYELGRHMIGDNVYNDDGFNQDMNHILYNNPEKKFIYRYLGIGMTFDDVQEFCPNIRHFMMEELRFRNEHDRMTEMENRIQNILARAAGGNDGLEEGELDTTIPSPSLPVITRKLCVLFTQTQPGNPHYSLSDNKEECGICYEKENDVVFNCKHEYCSDCVFKLFDHLKHDYNAKQVCPLCRANISRVCLQSSEMINRMKIAFT